MTNSQPSLKGPFWAEEAAASAERPSRTGFFDFRGAAVVAGKAHNLEVGSSTLSPGSNFRFQSNGSNKRNSSTVEHWSHTPKAVGANPTSATKNTPAHSGPGLIETKEKWPIEGSAQGIRGICSMGRSSYTFLSGSPADPSK